MEHYSPIAFTLREGVRPEQVEFSYLITEDEEGSYEPVGCVLTIAEAETMAACDLALRLKRLERDQDPGICPYIYKLFARSESGHYAVIASSLVATSAAI